jgi:hypothetical protein
MSTTCDAEKAALPVIGETCGGGYLGALLPAADRRYWAVIVAPKAEGEKEDVMWGTRNFPVPGSRSFTDGWGNSQVTSDGHHPAAQFCRAVRSGGYDDWYLPSIGELAAIWANLGPAHTAAAQFQLGAGEAFEESWYWSSTEVALDPSFAWGQAFDDKPFGTGWRNRDDKYSPNWCRAVRRVLL